MARLKRIHVEGFASFRCVDLDLHQVNVLIGGNGAGKSNLVKLFRMLKALADARLQDFVVRREGGANLLLHYGAKATPQMMVTLEFEADNGSLTYSVRLAAAPRDTLVFVGETLTVRYEGEHEPQVIDLGEGDEETHLRTNEFGHAPGASFLRRHLGDCCAYIRDCGAYHFINTSNSAPIRAATSIRDKWELREDGSNLAPYLRKLELWKGPHYQRIVGTIRQVAPHFGDFVLEPEPPDQNSIMLKWREAGVDHVFAADQLPDGLLRFMALSTLLLQPEDTLPWMIVIDEPELGLHPFALNVLASLIRKASVHSQIILATQSVNLVDQFQPEDIITVTREDGASVFRRLDSAGLAEWLKDYSLGELWEKNVIGGRPSR